ncbi:MULTISPECIES: arginase family protein [unclassified Microbacterium]|uniref:arginase family protein n=1 Tax=unclassified Microbacterium TaxID=2609290 RepID=UPI00097F50FD|nr:arginase family protein [Microbacterium sp. JB110]RCS57712.1 arginase family protein [Microbacterium sp. JB110]SJM67630.1 Arginase [Frigoribacterium sp. JB110]
MSRFVVVPQWQGSASSRAMALIDGAEAIAGDLPSAACSRVDVPLEAGEAIGTGVHRASSLMRIRTSIAEAVAAAEPPAIVVGGDATVTVGALDALASGGADIAVAWFSAHAALHSPETSRDGSYEGMALRAMTGGFGGGLAFERGRIDPVRVVLAGAREYDDAEAELLDSGGMAAVSVDELTGDPTAIAEALAPRGAQRLFLHVSLDVLDPSEIGGVSSSVPFGLTLQTLIDAIGALRARFDLAGATISGFAPSTPAAAVDDMGTILRLVSALTKSQQGA